MNPKVKTIIFILFSFLLGIVGGWIIHDQEWMNPGRKSRDFQKMLIERLKLDEPQSGKLDSILEVHRQKMDTCRKQMLSLRDSAQGEIRKILTPEQTALFDDILRSKKEKVNHDPGQR